MKNVSEYKPMDTYNIAKTILDLMIEHEQSWNGENYTLGHCWRNLIEPFLKTQKQSAFALVLENFGWQYVNDVHNICEQVIKKNLQ